MNCNSPEFLNLSSEILVRGNKFRFQARGESMAPSIRDGDIIKVEPIGGQQVKWGDVIFYRAGEKRMVAHRVIRKFSRNYKPVYIARGDSNRGKGEEVCLEQILGKVEVVERNGSKIYINHGFNKGRDIFYIKVFSFLRQIGGWLLPHVRGFKIYRNLAKKFLKPEIIYKWESFNGCEKRLLGKKNGITVAKITVLYNSPEANSLYRSNSWWISGMWVHWYYRGVGIGKRLTETAYNFARKQGAKDVKLFVFCDNKPALGLYRKEGFYQISIPEIDKQLKQEAEKTGRMRVVMKKNLQ